MKKYGKIVNIKNKTYTEVVVIVKNIFFKFENNEAKRYEYKRKDTGRIPSIQLSTPSSIQFSKKEVESDGYNKTFDHKECLKKHKRKHPPP